MKKIFELFLLLIMSSNAIAQGTSARLIVRGDDMGFSHAGNEGLILAHTRGFETSIEVIVAAPWFPEAVQLLAKNPGIDVGIHLALTSEWETVKWRPLTNCPSLKDSNGYFFPMVFANKNYPGRAIKENNWKLAEVEQEFRAQIELALKMIPRTSHISSHMGCTDLDPAVKTLVKKLAKEYRIDIDLQELGVQYAGYKGVRVTPENKLASFINMLDSLTPGNTYLFVDHPALDGPEMRAIYHIGYENVASDRQGVVDLFTSAVALAAIKKRNIQLISYADLNKQR